MPLSEDEQRILGEIEANLRASDPDLARQVGSTTVYTESLRKLKWGIVALVAALVATILLLGVSHLAAFAGFVAMVAAAALTRDHRGLSNLLAGLDVEALAPVTDADPTPTADAPKP